MRPAQNRSFVMIRIQSRTNYPYPCEPDFDINSAFAISSMTSTDTTAASQPILAPRQTSRQHHFFHFAPEIRNLIYQYLFEVEIIIRESDWKTIHHNGKHLHINNFDRDRSHGLNLLFVSRQCHVEAKPILMRTATFDLDHWTLRRCGVNSVFRASDMKVVRSIVLKTGPYPALRSAVSVMTRLTNVNVEQDERDIRFISRVRPLARIIATCVPKSLQSLPGLYQLRGAWRMYVKSAFEQFWEHATRRVEKETVAFTIKLHVRYAYDGDIVDEHEGYVGVEFVSETIWVEEEDGGVSPKVKVKGLAGLLDQQTRG